MTTPLATTILDAMANVQRHQSAQTKSGVEKLEHHVATLITALTQLNTLPEVERNAALKTLAPHRMQLDQTIANLTASNSGLKNKIMNTVKTANAAKGYGQYLK